MGNHSSSSSTDLRDLQQSVGALLTEIGQASEKVVEDYEAQTNADTESSPNPEHTSAQDAAPTKPASAPPIAAAPPADEDMAEQVDELIAEAVQAVESLDETVEAAVDVDEASESAVAQAADDVEELLSEVQGVVPEMVAPTGEAPADGAAGADVTVSDQEAKESQPTPEAIDAGENSPVGEVVTPEKTKKNSGAISALDAQLEAEASDFDVEVDVEIDDFDDLDGDFETVDEVEMISPGGAFAAEAIGPKNDKATAAVTGSSVIEIDSPFADEAPGSTPASEPQASVVSTSAPTSAEDQSHSSEVAGGSANRALALVFSLKGVVLNPATHQRLERLVLAPLAKPMARLDPKLRDTMGWVGVNTVFIAVCLWLFLILR